MQDIWPDGVKLADAAPIGTVVADADGDVAVKKNQGWSGDGAAPGKYDAEYGPWWVLRWGFDHD